MPIPRLLIPALGAVVVLAGCEDPAAQARAEAQVKIDVAARQLAGASLAAATDEDGDGVRATLNDVSSTLRSLRGGSDGQQQAAQLMLAEAQLRLGAIEAVDIERTLSDHRRRRELLRTRITAALRLAALADAVARNDDGAAHTLLSTSESEASARLDAYSAAVAELDGPIAERMQDNDDDRAAAERLRREANDLRRQAIEAGHSQGLADFKEAVRREREADGYDSRIAHRESDLVYDLGPRHAIASAHVDGLNAMIEDLQGADASLNERRRILAGDVATTRDVVQRIGRSVADELNALQSERTGELASEFESAISAFESAATAAAAARKGDDRQSGALAAARAQDALARLYVLRLGAIDDQIAVMQAALDAGSVLADVSREDLAALQGERTESLGAATAALTSASEQLGSASTPATADEVQYFSRQIADTLAALGAAEAPDGNGGE